MDEPEHPAETEPPGAIETTPPVRECPLSKAAAESATTLLLLLS
jgi:hypothetical protein